MATEVIRYVDPNSTGGDGTTNALTGATAAYASLSAWNAARARDLVTANEIERVICSSDDAGSTHLPDTTAVTISGWTTDATRYISIEAASSHGGKWNDNIYRMDEITSGLAIAVAAHDTRITGLQVGLAEGTGHTNCIGMNTVGVADAACNIDTCILRSASTGSSYSQVGIGTNQAPTTNATVNIRNTLIIGMRGANTYASGIRIDESNYTINVYNCTIIDCYVGCFRNSGTMNAYNCGISSCTTAFSGSINQTNCSSTTPTFVDADNDDFHLDPSDTTWKGQGTPVLEYFGYNPGTTPDSNSSGNGGTIMFNNPANNPFQCPGTGERILTSLEGFIGAWATNLVARVAIYSSDGSELIGVIEKTGVGETLSWVGAKSSDQTTPQNIVLTGGEYYVLAVHLETTNIFLAYDNSATNDIAWTDTTFGDGIPSSVSFEDTETRKPFIRAGVPLYSDDIDGQTRTGAWDIGADQYVSDVLIEGSACWGHSTSVTQDNVRTFTGNWTGTGTIENSGDSERLSLESGQYMESEVVNTGGRHVTLSQNIYASGDTVTLKYRTGVTTVACEAASWSTYSGSFLSDGYVQIRLESTL